MYGDGKAVRTRGGAHALHGGNPVWSHANRHIDLWVELLHGWDFEPIAALPFTVTLDFEGDQFTSSNIPPADLERLYGIVGQKRRGPLLRQPERAQVSGSAGEGA